MKQIQKKKIESPLINKNTITTNNIIQERTPKMIRITLWYLGSDTYNFELSMWSNTDGRSIEKMISRISKLNLSETAENIFSKHNFLFLSPENISEKEFLDIKINWLIKIKKIILLKSF